MRCLPPALLLSTILAAGAASAATLRSYVALDGDQVRVSDLFDDAGAQASRVLGPAPAPGGRIVVEAGQLAAIARQFGVDWRPASPAARAVLERAGRPLPRDAVLAALREALRSSGVSADDDISVPEFEPPMVPPAAAVRPEIGQLDYDPATGRFTALLIVAGDGMAPIHARISGGVQVMEELPVPTHRLLPGTPIGPDDLRTARVRAVRLAGEPLRDAAQAIGLAPRHAAAAGQPILASDLIRPPLVQKGATVMMRLDQPGLSLSGQGQALDSGAAGETIRVLNPFSRAVVQAEITGENRVRVLPGSVPMTPARRAGLVAFR